MNLCVMVHINKSHWKWKGGVLEFKKIYCTIKFWWAYLMIYDLNDMAYLYTDLLDFVEK